MRGVLVTGTSGFVGRNVARIWPDAVPFPRGVDLTTRESVELALVRELPPFEGVVHLAAQSNPELSKQEPVATWQTNLMGTVHLLAGLEAAGWRGRFLYVSSGAVYQRSDLPLHEDSPLALTSPYVASKLAGEAAALEWGRRCEFEVLIARPFNHSGPGQADSYFLPSLARQMVALPASGGVIEVGNLEDSRDFLSVDSVIAAYRALLEQGKAGQVYNVASGRATPLRELFDCLAEQSGKTVKRQVVPERFRPLEGAPLRVDISKIKQHTEWRPDLDLGRLCQDLLEDWSRRI